MRTYWFLKKVYIHSALWNRVDEIIHSSQAALQICYKEKVFWKYTANLQENTHAEMQFQ